MLLWSDVTVATAVAAVAAPAVATVVIVVFLSLLFLRVWHTDRYTRYRKCVCMCAISAGYKPINNPTDRYTTRRS